MGALLGWCCTFESVRHCLSLDGDLNYVYPTTRSPRVKVARKPRNPVTRVERNSFEMALCERLRPPSFPFSKPTSSPSFEQGISFALACLLQPRFLISRLANFIPEFSLLH